MVLTLLMYFGMFNLMLFACFSAVHFQYRSGSILDDMSSLAILALGAAMYICTFMAFFFDPDPFDYFRYSFRKEPFAMMFYFLYPPVMVCSCLLIVLGSNIVWSPMIPIACLLLFVIAYRPYLEPKENVRCVANMIIILSFLGHRVFVEYYYQNSSSSNDNSSGASYLVGNFSFLWLFGSLVLLFLALTATCGYLIYYLVYVCYNKTKVQQKDEKEQVMEELEIINVKKKISKIKIVDGVFQTILTPKTRLLNFSNDLNYKP